LPSITRTTNKEEGATVRAPAKALTDKRVVLQKHAPNGGDQLTTKPQHRRQKTACGDDEVSGNRSNFYVFS